MIQSPTEPRMKESVSNRVFEARSRRSVTQEDLASAVGVTRQTVIAIEKGNYTPSVLLAIKLARFFKMSVEELFVISKHS
ncbi:MAG TPA: helix-turn-helix transcriptional regulator [Candidatus Paceibacterota bacterium]